MHGWSGGQKLYTTTLYRAGKGTCYRVSLNKKSKHVKSPHMMSKPTWQRSRRQLYALGTLPLQPGACLYNTAPGAGSAAGEGKGQARGRLHQGAAPGAPQPRRAAPRPSGWAGPGPPGLPSPRPLGSGGGPRLPPPPPSPEGCPWPGGPSGARQCPPSRLRWGPVFGRGWRSGTRHPCSRRRRPPAEGSLAGAGTCRGRAARTHGQRPSTPAGWARTRHRPRCCQGRGEPGRAGPSPPGGEGRGAARFAPPVPPSAAAAGRQMRAEGRGGRGPSGSSQRSARTDALLAAQRFQLCQRNTTNAAKDLVWILGLILVLAPPF